MPCVGSSREVHLLRVLGYLNAANEQLVEHCKSLRVDSPFFPTIIVHSFRTPADSLGFRRFPRRIRIPGKNGNRR